MPRWTVIFLITVFLLFGNYNWIDLKEGILYYGNAISSTYPAIGILVLFLGLFLLIFTEDAIFIYKKYIKGRKIKFKI
jgi:hypothetical protein